MTYVYTTVANVSLVNLTAVQGDPLNTLIPQKLLKHTKGRFRPPPGYCVTVLRFYTQHCILNLYSKYESN